MSMDSETLKNWIFSGMDAFGAGVNLKTLSPVLPELLNNKAYNLR